MPKSEAYKLFPFYFSSKKKKLGIEFPPFPVIKGELPRKGLFI